jgi:hypothetical protein
MKFRLGVGTKRVTAESDGGISIYVSPASSCHFPVFCLEVIPLLLGTYHKAKRKKHRLRNSETTHQMHAAQIYAEMLGQVCHKELYNANLKGYQEVTRFPNFPDSRHSYSMQDMRHSTYSTPSFRTHICGILLNMVEDTKHSQKIRKRSSSNTQFLFACDVRLIKQRSSSYLQRC